MILSQNEKQNMFGWKNNPQLNKVDFFQEIPYEKCLRKSFRVSSSPNFLKDMPPEPPSKILPRLCQKSGNGPKGQLKMPILQIDIP